MKRPALPLSLGVRSFVGTFFFILLGLAAPAFGKGAAVICTSQGAAVSAAAPQLTVTLLFEAPEVSPPGALTSFMEDLYDGQAASEQIFSRPSAEVSAAGWPLGSFSARAADSSPRQLKVLRAAASGASAFTGMYTRNTSSGRVEAVTVSCHSYAAEL